MIDPVSFATAPAVTAVQKVERVRRRPGRSARRAGAPDEQGAQTFPIQAALTAEELASDETRVALMTMRLGG